METTYQGDEIFQLLVKESSAPAIVEEWAARHVPDDLRLRRAKTRGHVVVETANVMFANGILRCHPGCQVNIRRP